MTGNQKGKGLLALSSQMMLIFSCCLLCSVSFVSSLLPSMIQVQNSPRRQEHHTLHQHQFQQKKQLQCSYTSLKMKPWWEDDLPNILGTYFSLHFTPLHFTALDFTSLHFTTLHFTPLHFTSLHFTSLRFPPLHFTSLHFTSFHMTSLHFTSLHSTSPYFILLSHRN